MDPKTQPAKPPPLILHINHPRAGSDNDLMLWMWNVEKSSVRPLVGVPVITKDVSRGETSVEDKEDKGKLSLEF